MGEGGGGMGMMRVVKRELGFRGGEKRWDGGRGRGVRGGRF